MALATKSDKVNLIPEICAGRKELTPTNWPLTSTRWKDGRTDGQTDKWGRVETCQISARAHEARQAVAQEERRAFLP